MGHMCPRFHGGDFLHPVAWDHLYPKRKILHESNHYWEKLFCQFPPWTCCCCYCCPHLSLLFVCPYFCIFTRFVVFCLLVSLFLSFFPFSDVFQSEMWCEFSAAFPNHLQPLVSRVQETVLASKFVLIWLVLSAGSFGLRLTVFATCLPIRFMLRPTYSAWFRSQFSSLYLMRFTVSTGLNA